MITARFLPSLVGFIQSRKARLLFFALSLYLSFFFSLSPSHSFSLLLSHLIIRRSLHALLFVPSPLLSVCVCSTLHLFKYLSSVWVPRSLVSRKTVPGKSVCIFTRYFSFFFFLWFFLWFIYILWFAYRGFKIAYRILATQNVIETFRFCIAHFYFNLFLHEKKIYIYILCIDLYSAILFFFFFTYTIYNVDFLFILGYSVSSRLFD